MHQKVDGEVVFLYVVLIFCAPPGYLLQRGHATIERKRELQEELWIFTEPSALPVPM